jgi:hypothetical protein
MLALGTELIRILYALFFRLDVQQRSNHPVVLALIKNLKACAELTCVIVMYSVHVEISVFVVFEIEVDVVVTVQYSVVLM